MIAHRIKVMAGRFHCPPGEIHPIADRFYVIARRIHAARVPGLRVAVDDKTLADEAQRIEAAEVCPHKFFERVFIAPNFMRERPDHGTPKIRINVAHQVPHRLSVSFIVDDVRAADFGRQHSSDDAGVTNDGEERRNDRLSPRSL